MDYAATHEVTSKLFLDDFPIDIAGECKFSRDFETILYQHNVHLTVGSSLFSLILGSITMLFDSSVAGTFSLEQGAVFVEPDRVILFCSRTKYENNVREASVFVFQRDYRMKMRDGGRKISQAYVETVDNRWPDIDVRVALGKVRFIEVEVPNVEYTIHGPRGEIQVQEGNHHISPLKVNAQQKAMVIDISPKTVANSFQYFLVHSKENIVQDTDFHPHLSATPKFISRTVTMAHEVFLPILPDLLSASNIIYFIIGASLNFVQKHKLLIKTRNWWRSTTFLQDLTIMTQNTVGIFGYQNMPVLITAFSKLNTLPREIRTEYDKYVHISFDDNVAMKVEMVRNQVLMLPYVLVFTPPALRTKKLAFFADMLKYILDVFDEHAIIHYLLGQLSCSFDENMRKYIVKTRHNNEHVKTFLIHQDHLGVVMNVKDAFYQHTDSYLDTDPVLIDKRLFEHLGISEFSVYNLETRRSRTAMINEGGPWQYMDRKFFNSASPNDDFKGDVIYSQFPLAVNQMPGTSASLSPDYIAEHLQPIQDPGTVTLYLSNNSNRIKRFIRRLIRNADRVKRIETQVQLNALVEGAASTFLRVIQPPHQQKNRALLGLIRTDMLYRNTLDAWQNMVVYLKFGPHDTMREVANLMTQLREFLGQQRYRAIEHALTVNVIRYQDEIRIRDCFIDL